MTKKRLKYYWLLASLIGLSYFCLCSQLFGQQSGIKPMLGRQINWSHPLSRGLVGCWLMNEGAGNIVNDINGNGQHCTRSAGATWVASKTGPGVYLRGGTSDDYLLVVDAKQVLKFQGANDSFTVSMLIKMGTVGAVQSLAWIQDTDNDMWRIYVQANNTIRGSLNAIDFTSTTTVLLNTWVHLVVVFNKNGNGLFYFNGVVNDSGTALNNEVLSLTSNDLYFGIAPPAPDKLYEANITFDHIMIYNRALSASEIAYLYHSPFCMFKPSFDLYLIGGIVIPGVSGGQIIMIGEF